MTRSRGNYDNRFGKQEQIHYSAPLSQTGGGNPLVIRRVSAAVRGQRFELPGAIAGDIRPDTTVTLYANSSLIRNLKGEVQFYPLREGRSRPRTVPPTGGTYYNNIIIYIRVVRYTSFERMTMVIIIIRIRNCSQNSTATRDNHKKKKNITCITVDLIRDRIYERTYFFPSNNFKDVLNRDTEKV